MKRSFQPKSELFTLKNVGPAVYKDLRVLKIETIEELCHETPDHLYDQLQKITGKKHDSCMWDVFAALIHEAKTGEKTSWWTWTSLRKENNKKKKELSSKVD